MPTTVAPRPQADPDLSRTRPARIALVGERSAGVPAHTRYAPTPKALWRRERLLTDAYGLSTAQLDGPQDLAGFDGIWLVPDSPYRGEAGAVSAVRTARERDIPLPATCGGFLHGLLGFARHVCALNGAAHTETPGSPLPPSRGRAGPRGDCPHRARLTGRGSARRAHDPGALPVHARSPTPGTPAPCASTGCASPTTTTATPPGIGELPGTGSSCPPCSSPNWPTTPPGPVPWCALSSRRRSGAARRRDRAAQLRPPP